MMRTLDDVEPARACIHHTLQAASTEVRYHDMLDAAAITGLRDRFDFGDALGVEQHATITLSPELVTRTASYFSGGMEYSRRLASRKANVVAPITQSRILLNAHKDHHHDSGQ